MANSVESVFLVETSSHLRQAQKDRLCGPDSQSEDIEAGFRSKGKYNDIPITWMETMKSVPNSKLITLFKT